jgi:hypothetical protein
VLKVLNQQPRREAATTATTKYRDMKNTSKRTNLIENQPKKWLEARAFDGTKPKSAGYKEDKIDPE